MRVLVYDPAASRSGALSILQQYHARFSQFPEPDCTYFFVVSTPELTENEHVRVLRFPWVKRSWLHRLFFDFFYAPGLIGKYHIDKVFSLQNILMPRAGVPQELYLQQCLPFVPQRFSFWQNKRLWVTQHLLGPWILRSVRRAVKVVVQTEWIKQACMEKCQAAGDKFQIEPPGVEQKMIRQYRSSDESLRTFFYPALPQIYKDHAAILKACALLAQKGIMDYRVLFTFKGDENPLAVRLKKEAEAQHLPIEFCGRLPKKRVFELYAESTLLFPSFLETFGMPLLEARQSQSPVLAADTPFAREILSCYTAGKLFPVSDAEALAGAMRNILSKGGE